MYLFSFDGWRSSHSDFQRLRCSLLITIFRLLRPHHRILVINSSRSIFVCRYLMKYRVAVHLQFIKFFKTNNLYKYVPHPLPMLMHEAAKRDKKWIQHTFTIEKVKLLLNLKKADWFRSCMAIKMWYSESGCSIHQNLTQFWSVEYDTIIWHFPF